MTQFELMLEGGKRVIWEGKNWQDAIARYLDCHPNQTVIAWRITPQHGIFVGTHKRIAQ